MFINLKLAVDIFKYASACMRIGLRNDCTASNIISCDGHEIPWCNEIRYMGTYIVQVDGSNVLLIMQKNHYFVHLTLSLVKLVEIRLRKSCWSKVKVYPILIYGLECFFTYKK